MDKIRKLSKKRKILVLEDEIALQNVVKHRLEQAGFKVFVADSKEGGIKVLEKEKGVDVFWIDHELIGHESGLDFLAEVKKDKRWSDTLSYIISNTSFRDKRDIYTSYLKLGINNYFVKAENPLSSVVDAIVKDIEKD